jgi:hypothetical protein
MPQKTVIKSQQFECPKCNRDVTFRYTEIQFFADESDAPIAKTVDEILSYGQCQVAADAKIQGHPIHSEMVECPIYEALKK